MTRRGVTETFADFDVEWWTDKPPDSGPVREVTDGAGIRSLLVTTKAAAALPEVDRLRRYLSQESTVAFAQNGMSKLWPPVGPAYVSERYSAATHPNFLACVTKHGVTSNGPFDSVHTALADLTIGPVLLNPSTSEQSRYVSHLLATAPHLDGMEVSRPEIWILQLEKLIVNAIINPLTAFLGCVNGGLYEDESGVVVKVMNSLADEASAVLRALVKHDSNREILEAARHDLPPVSPRQTRSLIQIQQQLLDRFSPHLLRKMLHDVGFKVRANTSSMLQDIRAGRETEIRHFNGWLVDTAVWMDEGLDVRGHKLLVGLIESGASGSPAELGKYFDHIT